MAQHQLLLLLLPFYHQAEAVFASPQLSTPYVYGLVDFAFDLLIIILKVRC